MSLLDQVKGISAEKPNKFVVLMGFPGSGKTTLAGTFPKPMLYVTIGNDGGGVVLQGYSDNDIKEISLSTDKDGTSCAKAIMLLKELKSNSVYKTVVFDAWTSVQEEMEQYFTAVKGCKLNFDEWSAIGNSMLTARDLMVENSRNTDTYYVTVCHTKEKEIVDNLTNEVSKYIVPKLTGTNGKILLERANIVVYCCRKTIKDKTGKSSVAFLSYVGAHPNIDTKFRTSKKLFDGVGTYIENCTFDKLMALQTGVTPEKVNVVESAKNPFGEGDKDDE